MEYFINNGVDVSQFEHTVQDETCTYKPDDGPNCLGEE